MKKKPSNLVILPLSFAHVAVGMLFFIAALSAAIHYMPKLAELGTFRTTYGWLLAHMILLGFATFVAIGASYQLIQVIMRTSLYSKGLGWVAYGGMLSGLMLILLGFTVDVRLIAVGGATALIGMLLYSSNLFLTLLRKQEWTPFVLGMICSLMALLCTGMAGMLMGLTISGHLSLRYDSLFATHLWLGVGGWLSGLIIVFSFKLLPMFYISSKKVPKDAYIIIAGYHIGIWLNVIAHWTDDHLYSQAGIIVLLLSFARFAIYVEQVRRTSRAKIPVGTVRIASFYIPVVWLIFSVWVVNGWLGYTERVHLEGLIGWIVGAWFAGSILAYLSKILPFLWWGHRFTNKERRKDAVLLSDMLPERRLTWELGAYLVGFTIMMLGYTNQSVDMTKLGIWMAAGGAFLYILELLRVFRW